ncbi:MAG: SDR family NAD(P)-dependent oxidoreductase [Dehalococcoidales bacterium]|nr:SDR family NAD(P)-dependent oxidoreductase [Dehalococcoidales bacterium]
MVTVPGISLEGQVAVVTGARRGIGKDTALVLAAAGADVVVSDLVTEKGELDAVVAEIKAMGRKALGFKTDVRDRTQVDEMVKKTAEAFGRIDILVNNAGIGLPEGPHEPEKFEARQKEMQEHMAEWTSAKSWVSRFNEENFEKILNTNLRSIMVCTRAVSDVMIKNNRGAIVNVSSIQSFDRGGSAGSPYSISKRGINMLTESLAVDLARHNIRVNAIAPGGIVTEMMRDFTERPQMRQMLESRMLLGGKLISPEPCGHLVLFLVSDLSKYVTGQIICVDAGLNLARG